MKNLSILLIGLFLSITGSSQSCLPQGITFSTQAQIDNFHIDYPNCTQIDGLVEISGSDIHNLNGLSVLTSIGIGLHITSCHNLTSLSGLHNITSIGVLHLSDNPSLTNLAGLESLTTITVDFFIFWCSSLTSLTGLNSLSSFTGNFYINNNSALTSMAGLNALTHLGGSLSIWFCGNLTSLAGLESLTSIGDNGGNLDLYANDSLTSLTGLNNVTSIGVLLIRDNPALTSLAGLSNVTYIGGVSISSNNSLTSLAGLDSIEPNSIECLILTDNPVLSACAVQGICDYLANPIGTTDIHGNATGCNSIEEVEDACGITSAENLTAPGSCFTIYPNPASSIINVETLAISARSRLSIVDVNGQERITRPITEPKTQIDISNLPNGVYFVRMTGDSHVTIGKFIKY